MAFRQKDELVALLPRLRRYALALCRGPAEAEDIVQGACVRALSSLDGFVPGARFDAWVFRILRNHWVDRMRHARLERPPPNARPLLLRTEGETGLIAKLTLQDVGAAIARLPADQREVLLLVCVEDLSYREASILLGVPIGTVMSRLARARQKLIELTAQD